MENPGAFAGWSFVPRVRRGVAEPAPARRALRQMFQGGRSNVESSDPDALMVWLQGRGDIVSRSQKPLRVGAATLRLSPDGFCHRRHEGRDRRRPPSRDGWRFRTAWRRRLEGRGGFEARSGSTSMPQRRWCVRWPARRADWPDEGAAFAPISGRRFPPARSCAAVRQKLGYSRTRSVIDRLKIGQPDNVMLDGAGNFDRVNATGKLVLNSTAASLGQLAGPLRRLRPRCRRGLNGFGNQGRARHGST